MGGTRVATLVRFFESLRNPAAQLAALQRDDATTKAERNRLPRISTAKHADDDAKKEPSSPTLAQIYMEMAWMSDFRKGRRELYVHLQA